MAKATQDQMAALRAKFDAIANKIKTDPSFKERVSKDPAGVFRSEGIPEEAIADLQRASKEPDVTGYDWDVPCYYTCWWGTYRYCYDTVWFWCD